MELDIVKDSIKRIKNEFREKPFNYLNENDIRSILFSYIYNGLKEQDIRAVIKVEKYIREFNNNFLENGNIIINPVKTEYSGRFPVKEKFDIAIINKEKIKVIDDFDNLAYKFKNNPFWSQPVKIGIEIKYIQIDFNIKEIINKIEKDLKKLENYKKHENNDFTGLSLIFVQTDEICNKIKNEVKKRLLNRINNIHMLKNIIHLTSNSIKIYFISP